MIGGSDSNSHRGHYKLKQLIFMLWIRKTNKTGIENTIFKLFNLGYAFFLLETNYYVIVNC